MQAEEKQVNRFLFHPDLEHTTCAYRFWGRHTSPLEYQTGMAYCSPDFKESRIMTTEERLIDLEIRLTRQDDLVDTLNTQVYRQQKKIDELEALCAAMAARLREVAVAASQRTAVVDERPPHY
ncbi:SlyX family protein [Undibacterium sp. TC9W]